MKQRKPSGPIATFAEVKRRTIFDALDKCGGDVALAAKHLGIGKTTLYRFLDSNHYTKREADDDHSEFLESIKDFPR